MNYLAIKDLKAPLRVRETLATYGTAFVTNNGKPIALMMEIASEDDPQELERVMRLTRARMALSAIREQSRRNGVSKISQQGIQEEIKAVRSAKKKHA